mgnify:CR=1 FL=1
MFSKKLMKAENCAYAWMARNGIPALRITMGIVFIWFGFQKFFPGLSSAQDIATRTIEVLSFGIVSPVVSMPLLAAWEVIIGLGFVTGLFLKATTILLLLQMAGTFTPLLIFPAETFSIFPIVPTIVGQYIIKNIVFIAAAFVILAYNKGLLVVKN